jgi:hypothetical protein
MTSTERVEILAKLAAGREALLASLQGLSDTEAAARPAPDRWSAIGNVEHLAIVETNMLRLLQSAQPSGGEPQPGRENDMFVMVQNRDRKISAPPQAQPAGECETLAAALQRFEAARSRTIAYLEACDRELRLCTMNHPLAGPITGMECIHIMAAHPIRHAAQIRELRNPPA